MNKLKAGDMVLMEVFEGNELLLKPVDKVLDDIVYVDNIKFDKETGMQITRKLRRISPATRDDIDGISLSAKKLTLSIMIKTLDLEKLDISKLESMYNSAKRQLEALNEK